MKYFVLSSFIFATLLVNAQTNTFPTSGNVGIGTTTPSRTLDVAGDATANNFYLKGAWNGAKISGNGETVDYLSSWYHSFYSVTNSVPTLFLNARSGNVGIGTSTPTGALDVQGGIVAKYPSGNQLSIQSNAWRWDFDVDEGSGNNFRLRNMTSATVPFIVTTTGNVGIGTTTPQWKLDVAGLISSNGQAIINVDATSINLGDVASGDGLRDKLYFSTRDTKRVVIDENGNVGIGTTNPTQKLTVNGTIYGKEVKVDLSVPGPDYVFANNYQLLTLNELKTYIDQHKHLPEVPSAKEMEANGINVGEMNMLLLKKIEELTLYVIELNNKSEKSELENSQLKKRVLELENIKK